MALTDVPVELSSTPSIVDGGNAAAITIDSSENVGIGVTNPSDYFAKNLVVSAGDEQGITIVSDPAHQAYLMFADGTSGSQRYRGYIAYDHSSDNFNVISSGTMRFYTNDPSTEKMRITSGGNVGIGTDTPTTAPSGAFTWASPITTLAGTRPALYLNGSSSYTTLRMWPSGVDGASTSVDDWHVNTVSGGTSGGRLSFQPQGGAVGAEGLSLKPDGKVGIGTYTPDAKLHVYGTDPVIRVSDDGTSGFATLELRQQNVTSEGFEISYNSGTGHTHLNNVYSSGDTVFGTATGSFGTTSTNVRMKITSNGHVSIPSQPHWFGSATNTSGSGLANAQTPHSSHSRNTINVTTVSGALRWIIPRTGVYVIAFNTIADSGSGRVDTNIYINGSGVSSQLSPSHASATNQYRQRSATLVVYVQENDYVQFSHQDWYNASSNVFEVWRTISLTMVS